MKYCDALVAALQGPGDCGLSVQITKTIYCCQGRSSPINSADPKMFRHVVLV